MCQATNVVTRPGRVQALLGPKRSLPLATQAAYASFLSPRRDCPLACATCHPHFLWPFWPGLLKILTAAL